MQVVSINGSFGGLIATDYRHIVALSQEVVSVKYVR